MALSFFSLDEDYFKSEAPEISFIVRKEGKGALFFGFDPSYADSNKEILKLTTPSIQGAIICSFLASLDMLEDEVIALLDIS